MTGEYERFELDMFEELIRPGQTVIDVGANIGVHSILASKNVGTKGQVYSFEPVKDNIESLKNNLKLNKANNVIVTEALVGSKSAKKEKIYIQPNSVGTHSVLSPSDKFEEMPIVSLDDFVKTTSVKNVDLIKIDVEGYEGFVLEGARKLLKQQKPILFMEFDVAMLAKSSYDKNKILDDLFKLYPYRYLLDEKNSKLAPVDKQELQQIRNANLLFASKTIGSKNA